MTTIRQTTALAAATATVLATTAFLTLPAFADDASAKAAPSAIDLTDGTLDWGVKESFRKYVEGPIGGGDIVVGDGAAKNADGTFRFTDGKGSYDEDSHAVDVAFKGSLHFTAHQGELDLAFGDLKLSTDDGLTGALTADITVSGETQQDVELADVAFSEAETGTGEDGKITYKDIPTTLTEDGAEAFNGFYQAGDALDPATLAVKPAGGPGGPGGGSGAGGAGGGDAEGANGGAAQGSTGSGGSSGTSGGSDSGTSGNGGSGTSGGGEDGGQSGEVVDGNLDWGVKASFRSYVTGPIASGKVELSGGADEHSAGYRFPGGSGDFDGDAPSLDAGFDGGVRFLGHQEGGSYALDLKFSDLRITANGTKGSLVADVSSKDRESGKVSQYDDLPVASLKIPKDALTPAKDIVTLAKVPATLTEDGAKAFGGFYEAGDALDPVTAAVSLDENAQLPGAGSGGSNGSSGGSDGGTDSGGTTAPAGTVGGSGSLASTGSDLPALGLLGGAAGLAAIGAAAAYATRRRTAQS